jgi:hypothetical protein
VDVSAIERRLGAALAILGALMIAALTLTPSGGGVSPTSLCVFCGEYGGADFLLNLAFFVPYGLGLGLRHTRLRLALALVVLTTLSVELLQMTVVHGRDANLGDLLSNSIGGWIGIAMGRQWRALLFPDRRQARILASGWTVVWLAAMLTGAYVVRPSFTRIPYFDEWAPGRQEENRFRGTVLDVRLGGRTFPDDDPFGPGMPDPAAFTRAVLAGEPVSVTVTAGPPTAQPIPILRVVDNDEEELVLFAQQGTDLYFLVRTGARDLRFRGPMLALADVFPAESEGDTLTLIGALRDDRLIATVSGGRGSMSRELVLRPSLSWSVLVPFFFGTTEEQAGLLDALWSACLLLPLAFWAGRSRERIWGSVALPAAAAAGLLIPPVLTSMALPSLPELAVVAVVVIAGRALGRLRRDEARAVALGIDAHRVLPGSRR